MNNPGTISQKLETLTRLTEGYDAFLYDCDGTLADNMQAHKDAYVKVAASYGLEMDPAIIDEFAGLPTILVVQEVNKRYGTQIDPTEFATAKSQTFFEDYIEKTLPVDFVVAHLKAHHGKVRIAVVSGGSRKTVTKTLTVLGIFDLVEVMVCAGETPNGKPYPDPFLKAAELLNIAPERCFVFEDGEPGVTAASAAGMKSVRVDKIV